MKDINKLIINPWTMLICAVFTALEALYWKMTGNHLLADISSVVSAIALFIGVALLLVEKTNKKGRDAK